MNLPTMNTSGSGPGGCDAQALQKYLLLLRVPAPPRATACGAGGIEGLRAPSGNSDALHASARLVQITLVLDARLKSFGEYPQGFVLTLELCSQDGAFPANPEESG